MKITAKMSDDLNVRNTQEQVSVLNETECPL
jgi:hypothetical protein